jgi:hypothetical protein
MPFHTQVGPLYALTLAALMLGGFGGALMGALAVACHLLRSHAVGLGAGVGSLLLSAPGLVAAAFIEPSLLLSEQGHAVLAGGSAVGLVAGLVAVVWGARATDWSARRVFGLR